MEARGAYTLVLQMGSQNLRIGFANSMTPLTIPNVIAYRTNIPSDPQMLP